MYHYLFTNDLRISTLQQSLQDAAQHFVNDTVPKASEDKSTNNNMMTLGFYFNLTQDSNCAKLASQGNVRKVVLNFIKKFQFPNLRTTSSYNESLNDNIKLVPMRLILKLLYVISISEGTSGYLTKDEIREFIFYNEVAAKNMNPDIISIYQSIKEYRKTGILPSSVEVNPINRNWKQEDRQIREMIKILLWSGCVVENDQGNIKIQHNSLSMSDKADIFEIVNENGFWSASVTYDENSKNLIDEEYKNYMDINDNEINSSDFDCLSEEIKFMTDLNTEFELNRIVFGAPGTGKSHRLQKDSVELLGEDGVLERVTFHPDYSYANFVGTYKPISEIITKEDGTQSNEITYKFVPGPFMRVLVAALKNAKTDNALPHLLLIEEINRAKVAAVFGDVFQLLDRDNSGVSEYKIHASEDVRKYLAEELKIDIEKCKEIAIPNNMFIWATMNSADQGVFPMDTAFKRRWSFEYIGINEEDKNVYGLINIAGKEIEWNQLRKAINKKLAEEYSVNEDKLIGPYFLSKKIIETEKITDTDGQAKEFIKNTDLFMKSFKSKVLMYLYEDAAKQYKKKMFPGCSKYSDVCNAFNQHGIKVFGDDFETLYEEQEV